MSLDPGDDDEQLRKAIELSKQTYNEERRKRDNLSPEDLMGGDPDEIERQRNYAEIAALFRSPSSAPSQPFGPRSSATLPYGFRPEFMSQPPPLGFFRSNSGNGFLPASTVIPPPSALAYGSYSGATTPSTPMYSSGSFNSINRPFFPLNTQIPSNVNHTPIIVPFQAQAGNYIDLQNSSTSRDQTSTSNNYIEDDDPEDREYPELQFDDLLALIDKSNLSTTEEEPIPLVPPSPRKQEIIQGLQLVHGKNKHSLTLDRLTEFVVPLRNRQNPDVFFCAPTVDYLTTTADSIKLIIHRDETWPVSLPNAPDHIEMTYEVSNTCEDLLFAVLFRFINPDLNDMLAIEEFTLKIYGTDEFMEPLSVLGKHPIVAKFLSLGKDVELMLGKKIIRDVNYHVPDGYGNKIESKEYQFPRDEIIRGITEINNCFIGLDATQTYPEGMRKQLSNSVLDLCKTCHGIITNDITFALTAVLAATNESHYKATKDNLITAIHAMISMYCETVYCSSKMASLTAQTESLEIRESFSVDDEYLVQVESIHNMPTYWFQEYRSFHIEVVLMYGTKNISNTSRTEHRDIQRRFQTFTMSFQQWIKTGMAIMLLPRETQVVLMVYGTEKTEDEKNRTNARIETKAEQRKSMEKFLGFTFFPLFDRDGYLIQGKIAIPLKIRKAQIVEPWGPKPMIQNKNDVVLVLSTVEQSFKIQFPTFIEKEKISSIEFSSLSKKDQNGILDILDRNVPQAGLNVDEMQLLWSNRKALLKNPRAFIPTMASVIHWNALHLSNTYALLNEWNLPEPECMLELLLPNYPDEVVRRLAIQKISTGSSEFMISLLPQFIEALRFEIFEDSDLAKFLLERATKDRRFATTLYWHLDQRVQSQQPPFSTRCGNLLYHLLSMKIPNFREEIACQRKFLDDLDGISNSIKNMSASNATRAVQHALYQLNDKMMVTKLRLPINPGLLCTSISIENCGVFNSFTKPLKLSLVGLRTNYGVIYKSGDDLRQDAIVLQLVRVMNDLWLRENLDLRILTYRVLPTGVNKGLIELVEKCKTLREVQTFTSDRATDVFKNDTISKWISRHNASEFEHLTAFDNFTRSCAAWCVISYVLGLGDRHNDNILISEYGHTFHIDFGKYMGDFQHSMGFNRDRAPFPFTPEMAFVINGGAKESTERFQLFADYCCKAFNILRHNSVLLLNIIRFMSCSGIPFMDLNSVLFVQNNLMLDKSDNEATSAITKMIRASLDNLATRLNFLAHTVAQRLAGNSGVSSSNDQEGWFSFTNEIYSAKTDGRIKSVRLSGYEKWRTPDKVYAYIFQVYRENEKHPTKICRTFDETLELYRFLARRFSEAHLPVFDSSGGFGRTQVESVAQQRLVMLQKFFSRFFELAMEITQCDLVYTFFHAIHRDTNPYFVKDVINQNQSSTDPPCIHLTLTLDKDLKKLVIWVSHAKNLPLIGSVTISPPDTYVKTKLNPNPYPHISSKKKTSVIKNSCNPTYNSEVSYVFETLAQLKAANIDVCVWATGSSIVRDNFALCQTIVKCSSLFQVEADRKGIIEHAQWYALASRL